ncbi:MAG: tRNA (N6-isopentenyl adenosine(37)-C2)-methylthiotransferase MiaB [Firmicutes bacterium]|nr:tRNA (N6-isopentenyl adenosine(37)-C2)-methylthiotransferase MiaB [Bacillota bacterium]
MREEITAPRSERGLQQEAAIKRLAEHFAGQKMTYRITTLGCQMNAHDSEKLAGILRDIGFTEAEKEETADLVLYNTCCVRENAELKVYGRLGYLKGYKRRNPRMRIGLCGCMMQEPNVIEKLKKSYSWVDLIFGTHNLYRFAELLEEMYGTDSQIIELWDKADGIVEDLPSIRKHTFKASVNIMYGCDNFCTYCIVPYVRGRERSRRPEDILREIRTLAEEGVREIELLGQNVNSYGKNLAEPVTFAELLYMVREIDGIDRIRFMTSHPKDLSDELIAAMRDCPKVCPHFHLPLQSGSNRILKRMNRHYTKEQYLDIVRKLREAVPEIAVTTDIMTGFPGETDADVEDTLYVIREARFDNAFTFIYSPREGTPAATYPDQIPEEVSKVWFDRIHTTLEEVMNARNTDRIGKTLYVRAEEINSHDDTMLTGRSNENLLVHFKGDPSQIGSIIPVEIDEQMTYYLIGHPVGGPCNA